jgi:hypothetical protein
MGAAARRKLTKRQMAVLERIDRRVPIKVIALELSVSETRINQHIRALKDISQVDSLNELVECYREEFGEGEEAQGHRAASLSYDALSEPAYRKNQLTGQPIGPEDSRRVDPGEIVLSDVLPLSGLVPWNVTKEPKIVPGVLDGDNAALLRLAVIVGIAFGILAAVVLTVTAAMALSEALQDKAQVPEDYYQSA